MFSGEESSSCLLSKRVGELTSSSFALWQTDDGTEGELEARLAHAMAFLVVQDRDGYRQLCTRLVKRYSETKDASLAKQVAHICSMGPGALDDYDSAVSLAERAVVARGGHDPLSILGAILCRAGRFRNAVRHLEQAASGHGEGGSPQDQLFLSMAYHGLGDDARAREELKKSELSIAHTVELEAEKRGGVRWPDDWMTPTELRLLRAEAESLLMDSAFPRDPFGS